MLSYKSCRFLCNAEGSSIRSYVSELIYEKMRMKEQLNYIIKALLVKGVDFEKGLTDQETIQTEEKFNFEFTPDLKALLQMQLPVSEGFVNWREGLISKAAEKEIESQISWPLEGLLFDVQNNEFWDEDWGDKPLTFAEQESIVKSHYQVYPKLIPIYFHRYMPSKPNQTGNPILSIYQMDVMYYGYDLLTYFAHEFEFDLPGDFSSPKNPKIIKFWSKWI